MARAGEEEEEDSSHWVHRSTFFFVLTSLVLVCGRTLMLHTLREQRGDAFSASYGCTGGMSSSRCRSAWPRTSTTPPHGDRRRAGAGSGFEVKRTARFWKTPPPPPSPKSPARSTCFSTTVACWSSGARGLIVSLTSGRRSRLQRRTVEQIVDSVPDVPLHHTPVPQMVDSVAEVLKILDNSLPDVEQAIEVPKIILHTSHSAPLSWSRRWRNSWCKCLCLRNVGFRRSEGALGLGVVRAAGHTWLMRVHDTGAVHKNWAQVTV